MKHSINLSPADEVLDGRHLDRLIVMWLDDCERSGELDRATVTGYRNRLAFFREWWADVGPWHNWELSRDLLAQFNAWLTTDARTQYRKRLTFNTRRDVLRRLRQCLKWALDRDYLQRDIRSWVPKARGSAPLRMRAELDELTALMQAAGRSGNPVRDQALVAIFLGTGLRKMEAVGLDVEDIRMNADLSGTAQVRKAKRVNGRIVQGRIVAFDSWTGTYLARLMDIYPATGPLFRTPEGTRRIGGQAAYRIVKRAIQRAGLADRIVGPHDLRRNFATWFAKQNRGELSGRLLSKQLGHSRFAQTDEYVLHDADDLVDVIRSPLAGRPMVDPEPSPVAKRRRVSQSRMD